ncbi:MAG: hypothetical protein K9H61_12000 [Bacteroidia bacterium]|nr:hypothetical protein [Bacteroidia bacterium]MCF8428187.1 hypothetical protein [Bacteroidia bacterium]MCF8447709.1 hypothetical protein [Bacteroidia bacterium]
MQFAKNNNKISLFGIIILFLSLGKPALSQENRRKIGIDISNHNLMYQQPNDSIFKGNFMDYISYFDSEFIAHLSYNLAQNNYEINQPGYFQNVSYNDCFIDFSFDKPNFSPNLFDSSKSTDSYLGTLQSRIICSVNRNPNQIFYTTYSTPIHFQLYKENNYSQTDSITPSYFLMPIPLDSAETKKIAISLAKRTSIKMDSIEKAKYFQTFQSLPTANTNENSTGNDINIGPAILKVALVLIGFLIIINH